MDMTWLRPLSEHIGRVLHPGMGFDVEDLAQIGAEASLECTQAYDDGRGATMKTWQWKKAAWAMQEAIKVAARHNRIAPMDSLGDDFAEREDDAPGPEMILIAAQRREALLLAVSRLHPVQRQLLALIYVHEVEGKEIARRHRLAHETVSRWHRKALADLRALLGASPP